MHRGIGGDDLGSLTGCKHLRSCLWIGHDEWECAVDVGSLSRISSLQHLVIVAKTVSDKEIERLGALKQLSFLSLFVVEPQKNLANDFRKHVKAEVATSFRRKLAPSVGKNAKGLERAAEGKKGEGVGPKNRNNRIASEVGIGGPMEAGGSRGCVGEAAVLNASCDASARQRSPDAWAFFQLRD